MNNTNTGRYTVYSVNDEGKETFIYDQKNLIPNNGLDLICSSGANRIIYQCAVSTDSTNISESTNQIPSIVASTVEVLSREWGAQDAAPYYYWHRTTFEFAPGRANGNLTKVGILDNSNRIFSVALFKDIEGKPTTIQPIENERLRIIYEHRVYIDTTDVIIKTKGIYKTGDVEHTITIRPALINSSSVAQNLDKGLYIENYVGGGTRPLRAYTGPIGSITSSPSNHLASANNITASGYVNGSFKNNFYLYLDYDDFNTSNGISSFMFSTSRGCYQIGVTPPLIKNNTQKMTISFPIEVRS